MITKLPKWVEYGAFTLSLLAGIVNAVGLLGFQHQSVSHLSGMATLLGTELLNASASTLHLLGILLSFMFGAVVSGVFISSPSLKLGRHYDSLLIVEGVILLLAIYFLYEHVAMGQYLASMACGLQNALVTTYSGAVIRTTHLTGVFTDMGLMIGAWFRGDGFDKRKGVLFLLLISGFISGGAIGSVLFQQYEFMALIIPATICLLLALVYRKWGI